MNEEAMRKKELREEQNGMETVTDEYSRNRLGRERQTPPYSVHLIRQSTKTVKEIIDLQGLSPNLFDGLETLSMALQDELPETIRTKNVKRAVSIAEYQKGLLETAIYAARLLQRGKSHE
jgi:hypothetical protein